MPKALPGLSITIKWLGESNGCYSENVDFEEIEGRAIDNTQDADFEVI